MGAKAFLEPGLSGQQRAHSNKSIGSDKMGKEAMNSFRPYFMAYSLRILLQQEHNAIET
jgi:hypothetical protein